MSMARIKQALRARLRVDERGTAMVEFTLVLIPLSLIIFGVLDFGRALNYYNDLTQLAGQGARAAAVNQNPNGGVATNSFQQQLAQLADSPELKNQSAAKGGPVQACIDTPLPTGVGTPVKVRVTFQFNFIPIVHGLPITLTATQTERFEALSPTFQSGCSGP
jgi:Flp pilus assembly protein TadG